LVARAQQPGKPIIGILSSSFTSPEHPPGPTMMLRNMCILLVLGVMGVSSAAIAQSTTQATNARTGIKSKRPYHTCMVKLQSFGFSPHAAMTRCRMVSPGGFSR
jgi:hypothetical protein